MDERKDADTRLARVLTLFLEQECVVGIAYFVDDDLLFSSFQLFWLQAPEHIDHPALLGQFRVEMVQRGYQARPGGKHPRWLGLALRTSVQHEEKK